MEHNITRGGKPYIVDKENLLVKMGMNPDTGLARTSRVKRIIIDLDENSNPLYSETKWIDYDETPNGKRVNSNESLVITNKQDLIDLAPVVAQILGGSIINGKLRNTLGYNYQRPFDDAGNLIPDTAYNTQAPPSNDYVTHNGDGTAISGNPEENKDVAAWIAPGV